MIGGLKNVKEEKVEASSDSILSEYTMSWHVHFQVRMPLYECRIQQYIMVEAVYVYLSTTGSRNSFPMTWLYPVLQLI